VHEEDRRTGADGGILDRPATRLDDPAARRNAPALLADLALITDPGQPDESRDEQARGEKDGASLPHFRHRISRIVTLSGRCFPSLMQVPHLRSEFTGSPAPVWKPSAPAARHRSTRPALPQGRGVARKAGRSPVVLPEEGPAGTGTVRIAARHADDLAPFVDAVTSSEPLTWFSGA
jgi:hypothetical protein